jgi:galactokinase
MGMEAEVSPGIPEMNRTAKLGENLARVFQARFGNDPRFICAAPGRINTIGEHTDYTGGLVLPAAIDRYVITAVRESSKDQIRGYSLDYQEEAACIPGNYDKHHPASWFRYVMGVVKELEKAQYRVKPFDICIAGDIPIGSGLSSSAALEMSILTAIESLNDFQIEDDEASAICQRAENNFIGVQCGIMDMLISRTGRENFAVRIDCSNLSRQYIRINLPGSIWLVIDSGKKRSLVNSEYNKRWGECQKVLETARTIFPERELDNLKDLYTADLPSLKNTLSDVLYKRVKHVITENDRVEKMLSALEKTDSIRVGNLLNESHLSLRDDYEVSCRELDILVEILCQNDGIYGARMMGAGFGGSVIALVVENALDHLEDTINERYGHSGFKATIWPVKTSNGAGCLSGC